MSEHLDLERVKRLLRGELEARESADVQAHLDECAECRRLVAEEREFQEALELDDAPEGDRTALKRLLIRVDDAPLPGSPPRRRRRAALLLGSAAAVFILALVTASFVSVEDPDRQLAEQLGISARRQAEVVAHLDELQTLAEEPWIAERYHTVVAVDRLIEAAP